MAVRGEVLSKALRQLEEEYAKHPIDTMEELQTAITWISNLAKFGLDEVHFQEYVDASLANIRHELSQRVHR